MLDAFYIFTKGGLVLWALQQFPLKVRRDSPLAREYSGLVLYLIGLHWTQRGHVYKEFEFRVNPLNRVLCPNPHAGKSYQCPDSAMPSGRAHGRELFQPQGRRSGLHTQVEHVEREAR